MLKKEFKEKCHVFSQNFFEKWLKKLTISSSLVFDSFDFVSLVVFFGGVCGDGNGLCEAESIFSNSFDKAVLCNTSISVSNSVSDLLHVLSETVVCVVVAVVPV